MSAQWIGLKAAAVLVAVGASVGYIGTEVVNLRVSEDVICYPADYDNEGADPACNEVPISGAGGLSSIFNQDLTIKSNVTTGQVSSSDVTDQLIKVLTGQG